MKSIVIILTILLCIGSACRKGIEFDEQYIRGRVFLTDTITGHKKDIPLKNKRVFLSTGDTLNYLYTTQTDTAGYFIFNLLSDKNTSYKIYAYDTDGAVQYSGLVDAQRGSKDVRLHLYPNTGTQNGIVLYAKDPQNAALPSVKFRIYSNASLAFSNTSTGFITMQADSSGKGFRLNLPAGDYWVNADQAIDTFYYQRIGKRITLNSTGFLIDTMMLFKKNGVNRLNLTLVENGNIPVPGAEVRIYNNLSMAQINDPAAVIATDISGPDGKISRVNLAAGTYYLNAYKQTGNDTLRRIAKLITITTPVNITDTMLLHRTAPSVNGFRLQAKDSLGGILPFTILYLYNSELLATQNSPTGAGSMDTITTDIFGFGGQTNLPAGDYFVNARKQVDTVLYQRIAKRVTINTTGMFIDSIQLRRRW